MAELTGAEIDAALQRDRQHFATAPLAVLARYDRESRCVVLTLTNGCSFIFPPGLIQGLEDAGEDALAGVVLAADGYALRWDADDVDITVGGLLAGRFGSKAYLERLAARRSVTDRQAADGPQAIAS